MIDYISLIITIGTILVSVGVAYGKIRTQVVAIKELAIDVKNSHNTIIQELKEIRKEINQHNHNFYQLEIQTLNKLHKIELQTKKHS